MYYGHWSETPDYAAKLVAWEVVSEHDMNYPDWARLVADTNVTYYVSEDRQSDPPRQSLEGLMTVCFSSGDVRVYRIDRQAGER